MIPGLTIAGAAIALGICAAILVLQILASAFGFVDTSYIQ